MSLIAYADNFLLLACLRLLPLPLSFWRMALFALSIGRLADHLRAYPNGLVLRALVFDLFNHHEFQSSSYA